MNVFESSLKKRKFLEKLSDLELENVLVLKRENEEQKPMGFVTNAVSIAIFIGPQDTVWTYLSYKKSNYKKKEELVKHLQLGARESYPLVLEAPSEDIMKIWRKKKK